LPAAKPEGFTATAMLPGAFNEEDPADSQFPPFEVVERAKEIAPFPVLERFTV